jgi:hypothetical protein
MTIGLPVILPHDARMCFTCYLESPAGYARRLPALYDSISAKAESMDNLEALPSGADVRCNVATGGTKARSVVLLRVSSGSPLTVWVASFPEGDEV